MLYGIPIDASVVKNALKLVVGQEAKDQGCIYNPSYGPDLLTSEMISEILTVILGVLIAVLYALSECRKPLGYPPGPPWLPFVGNLPLLKKLAKTLGGQHLAFLELAKLYETEVVGVKLGKEKLICVCSLSTVKSVLTGGEYEGRPNNFFFKLRSMGTRKGITGTDGELWKEQRRFVVSHLRALGFGKSKMEEMVRQEVEEIILEIEQNLNNVDLYKVLALSVLNILWVMTSGKSLRKNQHIHQLLNLLTNRAKAFDMSGGTLNNYPWLRFFMPEKTGFTLLQKINSGIKKIIQDSIDDHKSSWEEGRNDDLIYAFLTEMNKQDGKSSNFTDDQLIMVCLDLFIAGSTTTSNTINFLFLAMIHYPDVQRKVHQCIDEAICKDDIISYCDRQRVPYVEAVILECQRFFPVVPISGPRRVLRKTILNDYTIPKDATVLINLHAVHSDKQYWIDPEIFRPERFLDTNGKLTGQDRVLTFGLGKRRCLGDALAKTCIFLFFVEVMRRYKIENATDEAKPSRNAIPGITMTPISYRAKFVAR